MKIGTAFFKLLFSTVYLFCPTTTVFQFIDCQFEEFVHRTEIKHKFSCFRECLIVTLIYPTKKILVFLVTFECGTTLKILNITFMKCYGKS